MQTKDLDANGLYNLNETGITKVQKNLSILVRRGQKQVDILTKGGGSLFFLLILWILSFSRGGNADMMVAVGDSGWINGNILVVC